MEDDKIVAAETHEIEKPKKDDSSWMLPFALGAMAATFFIAVTKDK